MSVSLPLQGEEVLQEVRIALEKLGVKSTTPVKVELQGDMIVLIPVQDSTREADLESAMAEINRRYADCFRSLAK